MSDPACIRIMLLSEGKIMANGYWLPTRPYNVIAAINRATAQGLS